MQTKKNYASRVNYVIKNNSTLVVGNFKKSIDRITFFFLSNKNFIKKEKVLYVHNGQYMALKTIKNKSNRKSNKVLEIRNGGAMCKTPNPRPIQKVWISKDFKMVNNNSSLSRILFVYLPGRETPLWRSTTAKIEQHSNFILKESPQQLWQRVKDWPRLWWV